MGTAQRKSTSSFRVADPSKGADKHRGTVQLRHVPGIRDLFWYGSWRVVAVLCEKLPMICYIWQGMGKNSAQQKLLFFSRKLPPCFCTKGFVKNRERIEAVEEEEEGEKPPFSTEGPPPSPQVFAIGTIPSALGSWGLPCHNSHTTHFCQHAHDKTECTTLGV